MQKELSANFPFYEPQANQSSPKFIPQPHSQQIDYNSPIKNQSQSPVNDVFQKPIFGEDEINTLNRNSFIFQISNKKNYIILIS